MGMIPDIQTFVEILRREGQLAEISVEVDPYLEAAEIHRRVIAARGPAILFKNIKGSPYPLVTNLFGSTKRIEMAFGPRPGEVIKAIATLPEQLIHPSLRLAWEKRSLVAALAKVGLKRVRRGPVSEVIESPSKLTELPLLTTWEKDGGPFITLPLVYTQHPSNGSHNLGMYRVQRYDDSTTGLHMQIGKGGGFHLAEYSRLGNPMPVNIHIGGPPALILSAISPLPENVPELMLASLVLGRKLPMARNPLGPLPFAANSEFVLVGEVRPGEMHPEGPFGDHYGYYSLKHDYPLFRCKGMLRRKNPICTATVVGKPRQEDFYLGDYLQELLAPLIKLVMPAVQDLWSYGETGYHSLAAAVVQERYARESLATSFRILGEGQLSLTKFLLLLDKPLDLRNFKDVLEYVLARADFEKDLFVFSNTAMDTLDYTGPKVNFGSKGVLIGSGDPIRSLPNSYSGTCPSGLDKISVFCSGCLVVSGTNHKSDPELATKISKIEPFRDWPLIILVDDAMRATKSVMSFLWTVFTRFEPAADIYGKSINIERHHLKYEYPILIDARMKGTYPDELFCDTKTAKIVDSRWHEYFPDGMEMGD
ncbi:MAG: UbiD family decarboxylase, partial [Bdellovibrionales bacterium]|nr:UbiD family decarboxylase [Bdellovibrionales bacterium]